MKKLLLPLLLCLTITGCSQGNKNTPPRVRDVSGSIMDNGKTFYSYNMDFDFDGENEIVSMDMVWNEETPWEEILNVNIGDYKTTLPILDGRIDAVYRCDIDTADGVWDLAIITNEVSDDPRIRIVKYAEGLPLYQFKLNDDSEINDDLWLGYAVSYDFTVLDDNSIVLETQTPSYGMWSVYRTFERNENGVFHEAVPEHYDILPDFMEKAYTGNMSGHELDMWKKGYMKAYIDLEYKDFQIKAGEFVKPLYDNGKNKIYLEKESGEGSWISIDFSAEYSMSDFNKNFFFLAG